MQLDSVPATKHLADFIKGLLLAAPSAPAAPPAATFVMPGCPAVPTDDVTFVSTTSAGTDAVGVPTGSKDKAGGIAANPAQPGAGGRTQTVATGAGTLAAGGKRNADGTAAATRTQSDGAGTLAAGGKKAGGAKEAGGVVRPAIQSLSQQVQEVSSPFLITVLG